MDENKPTNIKRTNIYFRDAGKLIKFRQHLLEINISLSEWVNRKMEEELAKVGQSYATS